MIVNPLVKIYRFIELCINYTNYRLITRRWNQNIFSSLLHRLTLQNVISSQSAQICYTHRNQVIRLMNKLIYFFRI